MHDHKEDPPSGQGGSKVSIDEGKANLIACAMRAIDSICNKPKSTTTCYVGQHPPRPGQLVHENRRTSIDEQSCQNREGECHSNT